MVLALLQVAIVALEILGGMHDFPDRPGTRNRIQGQDDCQRSDDVSSSFHSVDKTVSIALELVAANGINKTLELG